MIAIDMEQAALVPVIELLTLLSSSNARLIEISSGVCLQSRVSKQHHSFAITLRLVSGVHADSSPRPVAFLSSLSLRLGLNLMTAVSMTPLSLLLPSVTGKNSSTISGISSLLSSNAP
jgi:hypothetical protein